MSKIIEFQVLDSTNTFLSKNYKFLDEFTFVISHFQTAGRGAGQNKWFSQRNKNLLFSFFFYPNFDIKQQFFISQAISVALVQLLDKLGLKPKIKWPNDILINTKKIAGILIENKIFSDKWLTIVGIGLNVNQTQFTDNQKITSLKLELNKDFEIFHLFLLLKDMILKNLSLDRQKIEKKYLENFYGLKKTQLFRREGKEFFAEILGVDVFGRLFLNVDNQLVSFMTKEIEFVL